jgi:hypothetical protein
VSEQTPPIYADLLRRAREAEESQKHWQQEAERLQGELATLKTQYEMHQEVTEHLDAVHGRLRATLSRWQDAVYDLLRAEDGCDDSACNCGGGLCADCGEARLDAVRRLRRLAGWRCKSSEGGAG